MVEEKFSTLCASFSRLLDLIENDQVCIAAGSFDLLAENEAEKATLIEGIGRLTGDGAVIPSPDNRRTIVGLMEKIRDANAANQMAIKRRMREIEKNIGEIRRNKRGCAAYASLAG